MLQHAPPQVKISYNIFFCHSDRLRQCAWNIDAGRRSHFKMRYFIISYTFRHGFRHFRKFEKYSYCSYRLSECYRLLIMALPSFIIAEMWRVSPHGTTSYFIGNSDFLTRPRRLHYIRLLIHIFTARQMADGYAVRELPIS